jgi:hypothetical protein
LDSWNSLTHRRSLVGGRPPLDLENDQWTPCQAEIRDDDSRGAEGAEGGWEAPRAQSSILDDGPHAKREPA